MYVSYLQIYNERIYDLLNSEHANTAGAGLRMRWSKKDQFTVENLYAFECTARDEALKFVRQGVRNKVVARHNLNIASSRSHCILTLRVDVVNRDDPDNIVSGRLQLVDLAGSERASQTGTEGTKQQREAIEINKSLFTLRQVITALSDY